MIYSPIFTRTASPVVGHSSYWPSVSEVVLKHKSKSLISHCQTEFSITQLHYLQCMRATGD